MVMGMGVGMSEIQFCYDWTDGPSLKYRQGSVQKIFACVRNDPLIHQLIQKKCPAAFLKIHLLCVIESGWK